MNDAPYHTLVHHYTSCFEAHGATSKGVDWPKPEDALLRHRVMLGVLERLVPCALLDLGCGYGAFYDMMEPLDLPIEYRGIDLSAPMIAEAKKRHPGVLFEQRDILLDPLPPEGADYVVMNGVMTEKRELSFEQMEGFAHAIIKAAFAHASRGIAFNMMSAHVDWQRDDLFHMPFDRLAAFLKAEVSRHFSFRTDYGLYEFTAYVYREPVI